MATMEDLKLEYKTDLRIFYNLNKAQLRKIKLLKTEKNQ